MLIFSFSFVSESRYFTFFAVRVKALSEYAAVGQLDLLYRRIKWRKVSLNAAWCDSMDL